MPLTWDTQTEWEAATKNNINVVNDTFELATAIPDSGILRYGYEDDSTTTAVDEWNNNNGTVDGGTYTTTAQTGNFAIDNDGTDDSITYPAVGETTPSTDWSVALWVYPQTISSSNDPLWHPRASHDYTLGVRSTNDEFALITYDGSVNTLTSGVVPSTETWYHAGVSHDGSGTYTLVVDGIEEASGSLPDPNATSETNRWGGNGVSGNYFDGTVDLCDIYSRELSSTEWSNLYQTGSING